MLKNKKIEKILDRSILPFVSKPGRYIGNELNVIQKDVSQIDIRFALAFPEVYEIAMSSQATSILYHLLNQIDFVWAERVFAPWIDMEECMRAHHLPLFTLESFTPLRDFDVIGFSLQYELTYTNILNMLDLAGIPVWTRERNDYDPLVIAGGPCSCNPEPLAEFMDVFFIGDAEEHVNELCQALRQAKSKGLNRRDTLNSLVHIRGVYVPSLYIAMDNKASGLVNSIPDHESAAPKIQSAIVPELKSKYYPEKPVLPLIEVTHDRLAIEIMRGCTEGCRFCNAGMIYRPTRERTSDDIMQYTKSALAHTGYDEVSFLSLSTSDYSALHELICQAKSDIAGDHVNFSFPSLRLDSFNEEIAEFAKLVRKSGLTFAPESGSAQLRRVINKNITDDDLMKAVTIALQNGWKKLKFYFMIGLPTETKEDVKAIAQLMERVVHLSKKYGKINLKVSISPFTPKAHTPFQWERQCTKEEFWEKIDLLKSYFKTIKQVKFSWRNPALSEIECILGRGDRRIAEVIYTAWQKGTKFDGWDDVFQYNMWIDAFQEKGIDRKRYLNEIPEESTLPWSHIDKGITTNFLKKERANAYNKIILNDCKYGICYGCGIQRKNGFGEFAKCYKKSNMHEYKRRQDSSTYPAKNEAHNGPVQSGIDTCKKLLLRIHFEKMGFAKYLSHLDIMRVFGRVFRRAGIKLAYSQGYNPRPKMSFGPALPLGYTSTAEFVDVELINDLACDLKEAVNPILPHGLKIIDIKLIPLSTPALTASINAAEYQIDFKRHYSNLKVIKDLLKQSTIDITRTIKGSKKRINIRPYIESIIQKNGSLIIQTKSISGRTARVGEILGQIYNMSEHSIKALPVHRSQQYIKSIHSKISPMDVP
jgi:radical SAM family uncharacterized protein/radical SAM-linked protein